MFEDNLSSFSRRHYPPILKYDIPAAGRRLIAKYPCIKFIQWNFPHEVLVTLDTLFIRRTGKTLFGELNIICPNETRWSQMHKMILS